MAPTEMHDAPPAYDELEAEHAAECAAIAAERAHRATRRERINHFLSDDVTMGFVARYITKFPEEVSTNCSWRACPRSSTRS